jgi:hypothetical protein
MKGNDNAKLAKPIFSLCRRVATLFAHHVLTEDRLM